MDGEVVEAPKHMMIKLEPNFETMAEDDEDQHIVRGRRHVTVIKEEIEDPDSDYYEHLPDDAEEYFDDDELDYVPKKRSRGRPKRSGSPSFTRKRIKREGGTRRPKDGRKIWKVCSYVASGWDWPQMSSILNLLMRPFPEVQFLREQMQWKIAFCFILSK